MIVYKYLCVPACTGTVAHVFRTYPPACKLLLADISRLQFTGIEFLCDQ